MFIYFISLRRTLAYVSARVRKDRTKVRNLELMGRVGTKESETSNLEDHLRKIPDQENHVEKTRKNLVELSAGHYLRTDFVCTYYL